MADAAIEVLALAQALIRCPSITPDDAGAQEVLAHALGSLGFTVHRVRFGDAPDGPVDNLVATIGGDGPHFAFAGHTDVVPTGDRAAWSVDPFAAEVENGQLVGRGAADMKGALAAMVWAAQSMLQRGALRGRLTFIITGDEEGPAEYGTKPLLDWLEARNLVPDYCLVGEPTSVQTLGDMVKIGRRGSVNAWITVRGAQGHVAYPHRAHNPISDLVAILAELKARVLDDGTDWFQPSNLEVTDIAVGNPATNVIPALARARLNVRFNDLHSGAELASWLREVVARHARASDVDVRISGEAFLTEPGAFSKLVADAVSSVTGQTPELSTSGGTSDARFIRRLCPVVEFGLPGQSMHKTDEHVNVADLGALGQIYAQVLERIFETV